MKISLCEVGPRDGLQNEKDVAISVEDRLEFIKLLVTAGLKYIEAGAFVSPKWVPQMADSQKLFVKISTDPELKKSPVIFSALVPNEKGMETAINCGIKKIALFTAASESFNQKNINTSIVGSIERFEPVLKMAADHHVAVRAYVSTAFVCPYEGEIKTQAVVDVVKKLVDLGIAEISIGDTIGKATPQMLRALMEKLLGPLAYQAQTFWMHFHDTYGPSFEQGTAWPNVEASLQLGLTQFDASVAGLGGCPYAPGASGNIPTNDLVQRLHALGHTTGVDLAKLNEAGRFIQNILGRKLSSRLV